MRSTRGSGYAVATILAAIGVTLTVSAAWAADFTQSFPAGQAYSFALVVSGTGGNSAVRRSSNGLIISGGTGSALTFSGNGKSVSFSSNGAALVIQTNPDGSFTEQLTGHNIVILSRPTTHQGPQPPSSWGGP